MSISDLISHLLNPTSHYFVFYNPNILINSVIYMWDEIDFKLNGRRRFCLFCLSTKCLFNKENLNNWLLY